MKGIKYFTLSLASLFFTGCGGTDDAELSPDTPVGFSASVADITRRSGETTTDNLTSLGIFACYTGKNDWAEVNVPNYMYNQKVERSNASSPWTYSPVKYWPNNSSDKITFFAYAPYADGVSGHLSFSEKTDGGSPVLTYTVPVAENDRIDLVAAVPLMNYSYHSTTDGKLSLVMHHVLTRVIFKIKNGESHTSKTVTSLTLSAPSGGTMTFRVPAGGESPCSWSNIQKNITFTSALSSGTPVAVEDTEKAFADFFLIPVGVPTSVTLTLGYTYARKGSTGAGTAVTKTVTLPASPQWTPGISTVYTLLLSTEEVSVETSASISWTDGGTTEGELDTAIP